MRRLSAITAAILLLTAGGGAAHAATRRALLVGINVYRPDQAIRSQILRAKPSIAPRPLGAKGDATYWRFDDLDGAINDLKLVKGVLESFGFDDIVTLSDQEATADAILSAMQKHLVDDAQPGDVRLFYYSGHGNHVRNRATAEQGGEDQTIVPADNWRNVPDIRDKEIARILLKGVQKGVRITFIADSCHSGSLARGGWNGRGKARTNSGRAAQGENPLHEPAAEDPGEMNPATGRAIDPAESGVLTLSAAQSNEEALEMDTEDGPHGAFTWALMRSLRSPKEPMETVFQRAVATLHANAMAQVPVMRGRGRSSKGIFGEEGDATAGVTAVVESVKDREVTLRGGAAIGIYPKSILKSATAPETAVVVTAATGLSRSTGQIRGSGTVRPGDVLILDRWAGPSNSPLIAYVPPAAPAAMVVRTAAAMRALRDDSTVKWLEDATTDRPTHVMSWNGSSWILESNGQPADLGQAPQAAAVRQRLGDGARFLLLAPPTAEIAASIQSGKPSGVSVQAARPAKRPTPPSGTHYWLAGRLSGETIEYAWVLPDAGEKNVREMTGGASGKAAGYFALPLRTDWVSANQDPGPALALTASRLARLRAWFTLPSPTSRSSFPYALGFRNVDSGRFLADGVMRAGEKYKLYLQTDLSNLQGVELKPRWVYVFAIDSRGRGQLVFPKAGQGNEINRKPYAQLHEEPSFDPAIPLSEEPADLKVTTPFGIDTYFLLTTEEPLDSLDALTFDGVQTRAPSKEYDNPLTDLVQSAGYAERGGAARPAPVRWSIEAFTIRSVAEEGRSR